jgi:hypothetical protein
MKENEKMIWKDVINGNPMTWDEMIETVKEHPWQSDDDPFFFNEEGIGYSVREIAEIAGIEMEEM